MIKKSILTALVMLAAYHFLLPRISHRFFQISGQQRENYRRAQRYLYDGPEEANVILGSSMAGELNEATLGPNYSKLTLPGGSILTGLEIIRRAGKHPTVVMIETNELFGDPDQEFLHDLFSPWLFQLRRFSAIFREEGRPSNFVNGIAEACVRKSTRWGSRMLGAEEQTLDRSSQTNAVRPELFSQLLHLYHEQLDIPPSSEDLAKRADRLADYVDILNRGGSMCIFFEMPIDSSLSTLASPVAARKVIRTRFPATRYHWLSFTAERNYETVDGIHLTRAEADRVTETLLEQVNRISISAGQNPLGKLTN